MRLQISCIATELPIWALSLNLSMSRALTELVPEKVFGALAVAATMSAPIRVIEVTQSMC